MSEGYLVVLDVGDERQGVYVGVDAYFFGCGRHELSADSFDGYAAVGQSLDDAKLQFLLSCHHEKTDLYDGQFYDGALSAQMVAGWNG